MRETVMTRFITRIISTLLLLIFSATCSSQSMEEYYELIEPAQKTTSNDKIEVLEIFWYGCPHCYDFEPYLQEWLKTKPDHVDFRLMPGILNQSWVPHARAFYTANELGIHDKIHHPLFNAIHKNRKSIFNQPSIRTFFIEQGAQGDAFDLIYNSTDLNNIVRDAYNYQRNVRITGVPSIIINGKFRTSPSMAGSYENLLKVMDYLVDKEMRDQ